MKSVTLSTIILALLLLLSACAGTKPSSVNPGVITGDLRFDKYLDLIKGKSVAIVANQTSIAGRSHLVDTLLTMGVRIKTIFAPEHGFRDMADAGESITGGHDIKTGISVTSLYGKHNKPSAEDLSGIDVVIFDIQDVGTRFYTYISTLSLVMESCARYNVEFIVLDRPNPNGFYFDGNILDTAYRSFVGMHPVPVAHGMTIGEYAMMVNGEGWLREGLKCRLTVIPCLNYTHNTFYELKVPPSPNLRNQNSVYLYPSLCFFEGTALSCGRGTDFPFQVFGSPEMPDHGFSFTPESRPGAKSPLYLGKKCYGTDLSHAIEKGIVPSPGLNLDWLIAAYNDFPDKAKFFNSYFDTLAGGPTLRQQIIKGMTAAQIKASWQPGLEKFGKTRSKYLLYNQ